MGNSMEMEEKDTNIGQVIVNLPPQQVYGDPYQAYSRPTQPAYAAGYPHHHQQQQQQQQQQQGGASPYAYYCPHAPPQQPYGGYGYGYGYGYPPHESAYSGGGGAHKAMSWARNAARGLYHRFRGHRRHGHGYGYGQVHTPREVEE